MVKLMTKKILLSSSGILVILFLVLDYVGTARLCGIANRDCMHSLHDFFGIFLPIFPLFFFSLVTYWMREEVYQAWFRFARWWIPLSMFCILLTPTDYGGSGIGMSLGKPDVAFLSSTVFIIVSIGIIVWSSMKARK
jgi:hypothetical protein